MARHAGAVSGIAGEGVDCRWAPPVPSQTTSTTVDNPSLMGEAGSAAQLSPSSDRPASPEALAYLRDHHPRNDVARQLALSCGITTIDTPPLSALLAAPPP